MKKYICLILVFSMLVCPLLLISCTEEPKNGNVTYIFGDGRDNETACIEDAAAIDDLIPERDGYIFIGWCTDPARESYYNPVYYESGDITLYARWILDISAVGNDVAETALKFMVKVKRQSFNSPMDGTVETSVGSGVIYKKEDSRYYILTNHHILDSDLLHSSYAVCDAFGNEYSAKVLASDPGYDLAVLLISGASDVELSAVELDDRIPDKYEQIVSIGSPGGILNSVTYGNVSDYRVFESKDIDEEKNSIQFPIIWHTAPSSKGSSGGAVLSADLKLVGINYAVAFGNRGEFMYTFAIPIEKVLEFFEKYSIEY